MKHLCTVLALLLVLGCLAGCGSDRPEKDSKAPETTVSESEVPDSESAGTGEDDDQGVCTYTVLCYGSVNNEAVAGVMINFCTDTTCTPVNSDETGTAVFSGPSDKYHVEIIKIPDGWELAQEESEWYTEAFDETYRIPFTEVEE